MSVIDTPCGNLPSAVSRRDSRATTAIRTGRGGQGRNRTADAGLFRAALYRLSYLAAILHRTVAPYHGQFERRLCSNSQDGGSGSCGMELAGVCACPREAVAAGLGRLGTRAGVAGLPCTGSGARAGRARRTLAAGFRRSPPLAAGLARCVMLARSQPPGERAVAGAGVAGSRTGRSSCRSRTTP